MLDGLTAPKRNLSDEGQFVSLLTRSEISQGKWQVTAANTFCLWRNGEAHGHGALSSSWGIHRGKARTSTTADPDTTESLPPAPAKFTSYVLDLFM